MDISLLRRYKSPFNLIRIGRDFDGGYVLADVKEYDLLISAGIGGDISFEHNFCKII